MQSVGEVLLIAYAKASPEDLLVQVTVHNRGPDPAPLHVLPTLWFRNTWSWGKTVVRPTLERTTDGAATFEINEPEYGRRWLV